MRILADENFPFSARLEDRILVTFDKDFAGLVFASSHNRAPEILLFRIPMVTPTDLAAKDLATLSSRTDWSGHFSVIEEDRIRMIPLPK